MIKVNDPAAFFDQYFLGHQAEVTVRLPNCKGTENNQTTDRFQTGRYPARATVHDSGLTISFGHQCLVVFPCISATEGDLGKGCEYPSNFEHGYC
jgi:hypothetical protein